ncbi:transcription factor Spi-C [Trichomycterus rosablanca]|uniref:transcription factor Spi-C n=1 Tax=Trichomycterus rosablanca TaxID=2290929 RepID=UPI002F3538AC
MGLKQENNYSQAYQTDLEVILEFLEEHCRQEARKKDLWDSSDFHLSQQIMGDDCSDTTHNLDSLQLLSLTKNQQDAGLQLKGNGFDSVVEFGVRDSVIQTVSSEQALKPFFGTETPQSPVERAGSSQISAPAGRGKKLRLFHFLFEVLEDPGMAHCVSWVPATAGVFRFSSTNKERVAQLWGQRKGNRRPMTYQKMSRALRNYTRSGEIIKVRKKLTYQFSRATLTRLRSQQGMKNASR